MTAAAAAAVRRALQAAVSRAPSLRAWAREHGLAEAYVRQVLRGDRAASARVLAALGLRRVEQIVRLDEVALPAEPPAPPSPAPE